MRLTGLLISATVLAAGLASAPPALADCTSAAGTTVCSQGDVRGADTGHGPGSTTASVPYCWWCNNNGGLTLVIARPDRPRGGRG